MADDKGTPMMGISMNGQTVNFVPRPYREMLAMAMAGGGGGGGGGMSTEDRMKLMEQEYELKKKLLEAQGKGSTSWMKAIGDILGIGTKGYDLYNSYNKSGSGGGGGDSGGGGSFWSNWFSSASGKENSASNDWLDTSKYSLD